MARSPRPASRSCSGRVTATGKVTGGGRNLMFLEGELHDEDGRLLATATGVYKKVREAQS